MEELEIVGDILFRGRYLPTGRDLWHVLPRRDMKREMKVWMKNQIQLYLKHVGLYQVMP